MSKFSFKFSLLALLTLVVAVTALCSLSPLSLRYWLQHPHDAWQLNQGYNPQVAVQTYPPVRPLSSMALMGKKLFFDANLSGSGKLSCASCHDPSHAYGPANDLAVQAGGPDMRHRGVRAVPSLTYLLRQPNFSIGPDNPADENAAATLSGNAALQAHPQPKDLAAATRTVPQGGLFWDGRANTLQEQAGGPLFNPLEMAAASPAEVQTKLQHAAYAEDFEKLFGANVWQQPGLAVQEALFAIARFELEDPSFHPFNSKFDAWLQGRTRFSPEELRGYLVFNDPQKGNCGACHLDQPTRNGLPPLLTDHQYEALGVPRNPAIAANSDPNYADLGLCGPFRTDLKLQTQYCGMFLTPTLRNVATRGALFHNGFYHNLSQALDFYRFRDVAPQKVYPTVLGKVQSFNDLPAAYQGNIDTQDIPFGAKLGTASRMSEQDKHNLIAFLGTLTDGYMH